MVPGRDGKKPMRTDPIACLLDRYATWMVFRASYVHGSYDYDACTRRMREYLRRAQDATAIGE